MKPVIAVENLSKKYFLDHKIKLPYESFRDSISSHSIGVLKKIIGIRGDSSTRSFQEEFWALKDVSFEVRQGDRLGIIGRNGAGKSTLLKIISRITEPSKGRIAITGRVASLLEVGTGFQPELTGRENIYLNGAILGMSRVEINRKFDEIVDFSEVERFLDTPVKHYSSGMYVRLAFAVAAHLEPEILIVDEVLAVGDAKFQKKCMGKMEAVGSEGRTIIFVSHNMSAIRTLCSSLLWLEQGVLRRQGSVHSIIDEYLSDGNSLQNRHAWHSSSDTYENHSVFLKSIRIYSNNSSNYFAVDAPLSIEFIFSLKINVELFYIGFHLKSISGDIVFVSSSHPSAVRVGSYKATCDIPANLLNTGIYSIHLYLVRNGSDVLHEIEDPISFEIHDNEREEGAWIGELPRLVRPKLSWNMIRD